MATETKATKRWPRKPGYYWMFSSDLEDWIVVEVSGSHHHRTQCFYVFGDQSPKARSRMEQKFGYACEWIGPLQVPTARVNRHA